MLNKKFSVVKLSTFTCTFDCNLRFQGDELIVLKGFFFHRPFQFIHVHLSKDNIRFLASSNKAKHFLPSAMLTTCIIVTQTNSATTSHASKMGKRDGIRTCDRHPTGTTIKWFDSKDQHHESSPPAFSHS